MAKNEVRKWEEELAKAAIDAAAAAPTASFNTLNFHNGGRITMNGVDVPESKVDVIILDFILENKLYDSDYDANNPTSPCCYAFGLDEKTMKPFDKAPKPTHTQCKGCPMNEFGTADKGSGKACKNTVKIAIVPAGALGELKTTEIVIASIPPTSKANFGGYVREIAQSLKRPPFGMVTRISCVNDTKTQFRVLFEPVEQIEDSDHLAAIMEKRETIMLAQAYPEIEAKPKPAARATNRFRK
jgi:hypothetical protein